MECPWCDHPVPDGARFCSACGRALTVAGTEERRVVTVLFADLVGFSTLAEGQDPERVKRWIDDAFERLVADVERFGGRVDKLLGDAVVALFGAPVAHEDDAERAVRAGTCMQTTLAAFLDERSTTGPVADARLRVGINTGEVLVGSVAGTDYTAMGDVVNVAARLQALAPPGGVLVGDATRALCSDAVTFEPLEPSMLRGRETPEQVWRVVGVDAIARPRHRRATVPFVGRAHERALLISMGALVTHGRGGVVHVVGEAGIGKSRLVDEFIDRWIANDPELVVVRGACPPYGESNPWSPILHGVAEYYGIARGDTADAVRSGVRERASVTDGTAEPVPAAAVEREVEAVAHLFGHPSGVDRMDPAAARDLLFGAIVDLVRRAARAHPVVLWIDDLHWAPAVLSDLLSVVAGSTHDVAVLLVTAARPFDDPDRREPAERRDVHDRGLVLHVPLVPLEVRESAELIRRSVAHDPLAPELVARLIDRSGGNPLFLSELLLIRRDLGETVELPGTLRALVAARLDELPSGARAVIDNAAILGTDGPVQYLVEFATAMDQYWEPSMLDVLDASGLLEVDGGLWRFRSEVVRDVAYATLTKRARAQRHAGVASIMADSGDVVLDEVAHHAACAAELVADLGPTPGVVAGIDRWAVTSLARSARRAFDVGAFRRGVEMAERALALVPEDDRSSHRALLLLRAEGSVELRQTGSARADLESVLTGAARDGDQVESGEANRLLGAVEQLDGDLIAARELLGRAVEIFRELEDRPRLARALRARGYAEVFGGSLQDAEWHLGEADAVYAELGDDSGRAWVEQHRAWISFLSGDNEKAELELREAADTFERLGDRSGRNWTRGLLAFVLYFERRAEEADALATEVAAEARRWGDDWGAAMMLTLTADLRLWSGRFGSALERGERALIGFRRLGDRFGILQALTPINRARVALGRVEDAERGIEEIRSIAAAFGGLSYPAVAASGIAMHIGQGERTVELANEAVDRMNANGSSIDEAQIQLAMGHLQCGRPDEAMAALETAVVPTTPFASAVRAAVHAALGDHDAASEQVAAVTWESGASYFDRAIAAVAQIAIDGPDAPERAREAAGVGDVVTGALVREAQRRAVQRRSPALGPVATATTDGLSAGWLRFLDVVVGAPLAASDGGRGVAAP